MKFPAILAAALVVRVAAVAFLSSPLYSDEIDYVALGKSVAAGEGYRADGHPTAYRPPGYPLFLAASFKTFGDSLYPPRAAQVLADLLSCYLVYALGKRLFSERVGIAASAVFALFPAQILYVPHLMTETIFTTLFLLYLFLCTGRTASVKADLLAGIVIGAATLVRPTILLLPAAVFAARIFGGWTRRDNIRSIAITLASALVVLSPWLIRNAVTLGRPTLTTSTGVNFWIGAHSGANGSFSFHADNPLVGVTDECEQSDLGIRLGMAFIRDNPGEYAVILAKKWAHFFSVDYWLLLSRGAPPESSPAAKAGVLFARIPTGELLTVHVPFAAVLLAAMFGLCCARREESWQALFLIAPCAYWIIVHLVFFAVARYRVPIVPLFMIAAAYAADMIQKKSFVGTRMRIAMFFMFALVFAAGWTAERVMIRREVDAAGEDDHAGSYGRRHDLESPRLAERWDEGIPLGNGMLGALVWQKGELLRLSLDRADLWDLRPMKGLDRKEFTYRWICGQVERVDYGIVQRYFDAPYEKEPAPTKIPGAALTFDIRSLGAVRSVRLSPDSAFCEIRWKNGTGLRVFVHAVIPSGWFMWDHLTGDIPISIVPPAYGGGPDTLAHGSVEGDNLVRLGYTPGSIERTDSSITYRQKGWGGFAYEVCVAWRANERGTMEGTWSISSHGDSKSEPASAVCREALVRGPSADFESHAAWWRNFWAKSSVHVPDPVLERQWYMEQYKFGSASRRGAPPISLQAVWTSDNGRIPPWKGDYHHDLNTELSYWPCYSANHLEEGLAYLDALDRNKSAYRAYTRGFFGTGGLAVPGVTTLDGAPMGGWMQYAGSPTISSWLAHHYYLQWRFSMDTVFLRTRGYPWLRETAAFLEELTLKDANGERRLPLSSSPEIRNNDISAWFQRNTNYDIALMRFAFAAASEMAGALGLARDSAHWRSIGLELPPLALSERSELMFAPALPYNESHRHFSNAMAIYPLGLIRWEDGRASQEIIRSTLARFDSVGPALWCGYSYAWLACLKARGKDGAGAARALSIFARAFCSANSFHLNGDQTKSGYSTFTYRPFTLEGNFAFAAGLQEMLLQSYGGRIEVFPAVPEEWHDVAFSTLRAEGAFLVSARKEGGIVREVRVASEKGGEAKLRNPFTSWHAGSAREADVRAAGDTLIIRFAPGGEISLLAGAE